MLHEGPVGHARQQDPVGFAELEQPVPEIGGHHRGLATADQVDEREVGEDFVRQLVEHLPCEGQATVVHPMFLLVAVAAAMRTLEIAAGRQLEAQ